MKEIWKDELDVVWMMQDGHKEKINIVKGMTNRSRLDLESCRQQQGLQLGHEMMELMESVMMQTMEEMNRSCWELESCRQQQGL